LLICKRSPSPRLIFKRKRAHRNAEEQTMRKNCFTIVWNESLDRENSVKESSLAKLYHVLIHWNQRPIALCCWTFMMLEKNSFHNS
jgi:hypothetical protein